MKSMTGFARTAGSLEEQEWAWEIKSVNGRGLDLRFRLPPGYEAIEGQLREFARSALHRGSVNIALQIEGKSDADALSVNPQVLQSVLSAIDSLRPSIGDAPIDPVSLLSVRGVLDTKSGDVGLSEDLASALVSSFEAAIDQLKEARGAEGALLEETLTGQVTAIEGFVETAKAHPSRSADTIFERLKEQVSALLQASDKFDEARLHQEAAILAVKADIQEELDRLTTHITSARKLIATTDQPVGRKLDFLIQEFNREANTLCSKSSHQEMTAIGLEMKSVIDQMREQVQNIE